MNPDEVGTFLGPAGHRRLADQLGFIYEEFWSRMTQRAALEEQQCLGDVAGLLVAARTAVPAELICHALDLRAAAWDLALRRLIEYITVTRYDEERASESVYRIYHESFADFLRFKLATDRDHYERMLAEYCLRWAELPAGYARLYALRFGPLTSWPPGSGTPWRRSLRTWISGGQERRPGWPSSWPRISRWPSACCLKTAHNEPTARSHVAGRGVAARHPLHPPARKRLSARVVPVPLEHVLVVRLRGSGRALRRATRGQTQRRCRVLRSGWNPDNAPSIQPAGEELSPPVGVLA